MTKIKVCFILFVLFCSTEVIGQEIKITHGPYLQAVGENEVTIVWTTDNNAVSWVEIAPAGDNSFYDTEHPKFYETKNGNKIVGKLHKVKISGLSKATEYRYRIFSKAVLSYDGGRVLYGNVASSNVYSKKPLRFCTLNKDKKAISFLVLNDIHSRVDDLKKLAKDVKYGETDFVIFNGDMVSSMDDEKQLFDGFMDESVNMFASEVPVFYSRGNHETRGNFSVSFPDYFPSNSGKLYYHFRQGPTCFIVLDSGEDKPDSDIEYSGLACFDEYRSEQQKWLDKVIESDDFKNAKYKVVIVHIPPVESDWHGVLEVQKKFLPALNNHGITAMMCGHLHRYKYVGAQPALHDFPIIINAHNTSLEVNADQETFTVIRKDTNGKELNVLSF